MTNKTIDGVSRGALTVAEGLLSRTLEYFTESGMPEDLLAEYKAALQKAIDRPGMLLARASSSELIEVSESALYRLETYIEAEREMPIPSMEVLRDGFQRVLANLPGQNDPQQNEPVAIIGSGWSLLWYSPAGMETLAAAVDRTGLEIGDKLYRRPSEQRNFGGMQTCALKPSGHNPVRPINIGVAQSAPAVMAHPFAEKVIRKLQRFEECASDSQGRWPAMSEVKRYVRGEKRMTIVSRFYLDVPGDRQFVRATAYDELKAQHDALLAKVDALAKVGELIRDQSNRCTDQPMFAVLEKRETITLDTHHHDRIVWVRKDDGEVEADERTHDRLERLHDNGVEPKKWARYAMLETNSFVTAAFTEQACIDYLERNRHNLRKSFIYAFGSFRNAEYQLIRDTLLALAGPKP